MKKTIKILNRIHKIIDPDDFYDIHICHNSISFQGRYTPELVTKYSNLIEFSVADNGWIEGIRKVSGSRIRIIIT